MANAGAASSEGLIKKRDLCVAKAMEGKEILDYRRKGRTLEQIAKVGSLLKSLTVNIDFMPTLVAMSHHWL